jgi:hopanoid biosynthesis associated RND transporter like protein HpnN
MIVASRTGRALRRLVRVACAHPVLTVVLSLLCAAAGVVYSLQTLTFMTSGQDLLPPGQAYVLRHQEYMDDFGELDEIAVVVEGKTLAMSKAYASRFVRELRKYPDRFKRITYRIDPKRFEGRGLLYLSVDRLRDIRDKIFDYQEFMESFAARPTLDQLVSNVNAQIGGAFVSSFFDVGLNEGKKDVDLGFLRDLLGQMSRRIDSPAPYKSPWGSFFSLDMRSDDDGYFLSDDQRLLFILVEATGKTGSFTGDRDAIEALRGTVARLRDESPEVNVGVTGAPALSNDEMVAAFRDSKRATLLAFALTLGLLLLAFLRAGMPILMLVTLAISLCWSIGVITLAVGHLSIFSVMFISIVIGIGIDYGIYFLFRHDEELFLGRSQREALEMTAARSGPGMLIGALTAAGTFYVLMATDFRGIQELGFIAGTAILLSWVSMMTLFPALILLFDRRHAARPRDPVPRAIQLERIRAPFIEHLTRYPKTVVTAAAVVTVLSLIALPNVYFDYNLLNLQALGTESVIWEKKVLATGRSGFSALASATSLDELRRKVAAFESLDSVSEVDSTLLLIPSDQGEKQKIIKTVAPVVAPVRVAAPEPVNVDQLLSALATLKRRLDIAVGEAPPGKDRDEVTEVREQAAALIQKLQQADREASEPALALLQDQIYRDFQSDFHGLQRNLRPRPVGLADVPPELRRKFIGRSGRFLMQIHPKVDIWDREGAERFVADLRGVDPEVTGTPIITFEAIRFMEKSYKQGTLYAFILVGLLSALLIRHFRETALAMLPLLLGTLWTVGLMYLFTLPFNLGNVFGLPLIIGAGAEFGLNVVLRYIEGREHGGPLIARSTVMAVLVNGLTTIVGFGSLMIADHRGIFGLGLLLTLGMLSTLAASLIVLPVMLRWSRPPATPPALALGEPAAFEPTGAETSL